MFFHTGLVIVANNRYRWEHALGYKDVKTQELDSIEVEV